MSKIAFFIFFFFVVSVTCEDKAEREARQKLERARAQCVASINRASRAISKKYHDSVEQLATLEERDALFEIVKEATNNLNEHIPVARKAPTDEVATDVTTAFGEVVHCREGLAILVSEITYQACEKMDALFVQPRKVNVQELKCRKCAVNDVD